MDFTCAGYRVSPDERKEIHTILDSAEYAFLGTHSPYESIQALDDQCAQLFPGWKKSLVSARPVQPSAESRTLTEVFADAPSGLGRPAGAAQTPREAIAADIAQLKADVGGLISRVADAAPGAAPPPAERRAPERPRAARPPRRARAAPLPADPDLAAAPSASGLGPEDPLPATVRGLEGERARLLAQQQFLLAQRAQLRAQVRALEKAVARTNAELKKSEAARLMTIRVARARR
jgi:hypothetical protein